MIAYVDPVSGASGDMLMGAIVDAGGPEVELAVTEAVRATGCDVRFRRDTRAGLACTLAEVSTPDEPLGPDDLRRLLSHSQRATRALEAILAAEADVHGGADGDPTEVHLHDMGSA